MKKQEVKVNKSKALATFKAAIALLVLSAGTIRTLVLEAEQNQAVFMVAGAAVVFFCVVSIVERTFNDK